MLLIAADRYLDWEITPLLVAYLVLLLALMIRSLADNGYIFGFGLAAWLTSAVAPWIARRLKKSDPPNHGPSAAGV